MNVRITDSRRRMADSGISDSGGAVYSNDGRYILNGDAASYGYTAIRHLPSEFPLLYAKRRLNLETKMKKLTLPISEETIRARRPSL